MLLSAPFDDAIGKDAIIQFPGGVNTQLYWHTTAPSFAPLQSIPENRVYLSVDRVAAFTRSFLAFSHGKVVSDDPAAPVSRLGVPVIRIGVFVFSLNLASSQSWLRMATCLTPTAAR